MALAVKNPPANAGDTRDVGSIPGLGRCSGEGNGNPFQGSCLEKFHGQKSLAGYSPWGRQELDTAAWLNAHTHKPTHARSEEGATGWQLTRSWIVLTATCEVRAEFLRSCSPAHTLRSAGESPRARGPTLPSLAWMHHPQKQWDNKHILSHKFWGNLFQWAK